MKVTLKAARVNAGYTQADAAKAVGVCKSSIVFWETGKISPTIRDVMKLLDLYHVAIEDIIFLPSNSN